MCEIKQTPNSKYYGIVLPNGEWMKCLDGHVWKSTFKIAHEILPRVQEWYHQKQRTNTPR